jgi:inner membrane protein
MSPWKGYVFCVIAANAPDLDFLPGLLTGDINRFHQSAGHSLMAAVLFGAAAALLALRSHYTPVRIGLAGIGLYCSHLLLDLLGEDKRAPFGIPLLWPFSSEHFIVAWPIFRGVRHGVPGEDLAAFVGHVFSWQNLGAMALETGILLPFLVLSWYMTGRMKPGKHRTGRPEEFDVAEDNI